ncbi:MAG TPA: RNA methyltransferase [Planctomycetes bacterium]|nr:RNA methyltransferase [Planctomycetaceae bacterium]HIN95355.1 RNA methyltransferase [Planctomycetota bacterium]
MDSTITSLQNPRVRQALRLRSKRGRLQQGRIIVDGGREIMRAAEAQCQITEVFLCPEWCESDDARQICQQLDQQGLPIVQVTETVMQRLAYGQRTDGMVAISAAPSEVPLLQWQPPEEGLVAVLEGIEKPGNVGALVRSADASGVTALILADAASDLFSPNAIRASVGTVFSFPIFHATSESTLAWLQQHAFSVWACRVDGETDYREVVWAGRSALVLGSEAKGLAPIWQTETVQSVVLPMLGVADSLNVSTTGAVLFYEALRQRQVGQ